MRSIFNGNRTLALPCVVVLDLKLPGISGKELCREFKALAAAVPIVIVSADSEVDDKVLLFTWL